MTIIFESIVITIVAIAISYLFVTIIKKQVLSKSEFKEIPLALGLFFIGVLVNSGLLLQNIGEPFGMTTKMLNKSGLEGAYLYVELFKYLSLYIAISLVHMVVLLFLTSRIVKVVVPNNLKDALIENDYVYILIFSSILTFLVLFTFHINQLIINSLIPYPNLPNLL